MIYWWFVKLVLIAQLQQNPTEQLFECLKFKYSETYTPIGCFSVEVDFSWLGCGLPVNSICSSFYKKITWQFQFAKLPEISETLGVLHVCSKVKSFWERSTPERESFAAHAKKHQRRAWRWCPIGKRISFGFDDCVTQACNQGSNRVIVPRIFLNVLSQLLGITTSYIVLSPLPENSHNNNLRFFCLLRK